MIKIFDEDLTHQFKISDDQDGSSKKAIVTEKVLMDLYFYLCGMFSYPMISLVGCRAATLSATLKRLVCPVKSLQVSMLPNGKYPGSYGMP